MGSKKKKWGESGGTKKPSTFSKKKMGNLKKKKNGRKMGGQKIRPLSKNGHAQKKNGRTVGNLNRIFFVAVGAGVTGLTKDLKFS